MKKVPIMIIASRRQIDSKDFGEGMLTIGILEILVNLLKKDKNNFITLCRDHGVSWQNNIEIKKTKYFRSNEVCKKILYGRYRLRF